MLFELGMCLTNPLGAEAVVLWSSYVCVCGPEQGRKLLGLLLTGSTG